MRRPNFHKFWKMQFNPLERASKYVKNKSIKQGAIRANTILINENKLDIFTSCSISTLNKTTNFGRALPPSTSATLSYICLSELVTDVENRNQTMVRNGGFSRSHDGDCCPNFPRWRATFLPQKTKHKGSFAFGDHPYMTST